ncbi:MAG: GyrI-like domain-containing protein [Promethearchaeota archaeon]
MPATKKFDFKREYPELYKPSAKSIAIINVPDMKFFMIEGKGNPNTSADYKQAVECLYALSYALKMKVIKKKMPAKDYVVPPLEGLWYIDNMENWSMEKKEDWQWTMMIRIPDFVTKKHLDLAHEIARESKNPAALPKLYIANYHEGLCVQLMHLGSYDSEAPNIARMHKFAMEEGYKLSGKHHEIYLSDPRRVDPSKLKTVLRQPIAGK